MPSPLYLCIHLRDFAALALTAFADSAREHEIEGAPHLPAFGRCGTGGRATSRASLGLPIPATAILDGDPPLERVFALNSAARALGLAVGMSRLQAESFPAALLRRSRRQEELAFAALMRCAGRFSPRIEIVARPQEASSGATLLLDLSGCERLLGSPRQIARAAHRALCELLCKTKLEGAPFLPAFGRSGMIVSDAISAAVAHNPGAALLAARGIAGAVVIASGREAATLAPLPLSVLEPAEEQAQTLAAWGIYTLGELAALPRRALAARVGQSGLRLQAQARGEASHLLVPATEPADAPLCAGVELEQPVELLEPLLFLLNQLLEQVLTGAAERTLAIASVELCLVLDKIVSSGGPFKPVVGLSGAVDVAPGRVAHICLPLANVGNRCGNGAAEDRRTIRPALPERDRLTLLKLIQLELESRPPASAVVALHIEARPARPQTAQQGLFAAQAPAPGQIEILLARLRKLVGEGRAGSPELLDSRASEAFRMAPFAPAQASPIGPHLADAGEQSSSESMVPHICLPLADVGEKSSTETLMPPALRLLRPPCAIAVELRSGKPVAVRYEGRRHIVEASSGPWRTSGAWWTHPAWCREEWDAVLREDISHDAPPCCLRLAHDPANGGWYLIGIYD